MWQYEPVHVAFEKCAADHLNSLDIKQRLYRKGLSENEFDGQLQEIILPVYKAASNLGFGRWQM